MRKQHNLSNDSWAYPIENLPLKAYTRSKLQRGVLVWK